MARIPESEIERLKRDTDLVALVQAAGVELRRHGAHLVGRCPFHDDQGPSLVVTPGKNLWHCLGACQAGGSVIDWVMRRERVSFRHAIELLQRGIQWGVPQPAPTGLPTTPAAMVLPPVLPLVATSDADDTALVRSVLDYYHATLLESPEAIAYLEERGLNSIPLIDHFHLGYANRTLGYRLPAPASKAGAEVRGRLQRAGLLRASGGSSHRRTRGRSGRSCARGRPCISTCRVRTPRFGTWMPWRPPRRSSCARRSSTR